MEMTEMKEREARTVMEKSSMASMRAPTMREVIVHRTTSFLGKVLSSYYSLVRAVSAFEWG